MSCTSCNNKTCDKCSCTTVVDYSKEVKCSTDPLIPFNTFAYNDGLKNLTIIGQTYCSWKESVLDFVSKVQGLYNSLVLETNPTRTTLDNSFASFNVLQKSFLQELKVLGNTQLSDEGYAVNTVLSTNTITEDLSTNTLANDPKAYFTNSAGKQIQKIVHPRGTKLIFGKLS